jgi:hypothetical protein
MAPLIAWPIGLATAAVAALAMGLFLVPPEQLTLDIAVVFTTLPLSATIVGGFLSARVPGNRVGWLLLLAGLLFSVQVLAWGYWARSFAASAGSWPGTAHAAWLNDILWLPPIVILTIAVPLVFPDGHLPSPRWRWVGATFVAAFTASLLKPAFGPGLLANGAVENPLRLAGLETVLDAADSIAMLLGLIALFGAVAAVVTRFRRRRSIEREQMKWLLAVTALAAVAFPIAIAGQGSGADIVSAIAWFGGMMALAFLPIAIGVAVVRYRLYEIDRIVSRTIGYTVVTAVLVAVFAGAILLFQTILTPLTRNDTAAVAASTLVVAALFQPLRARVQRVVDRRFDRASYDAERTTEAFAGRLRDEVDLGSLRLELVGTVERNLQPTHAGVWLRERSEGSR